MKKKSLLIISVIVVGILLSVFSFNTNSIDKEKLSNTFSVDAIYYDDGYVEISFDDNSQKTTMVVLEILGMEDSFQKTFETNSFVEKVPFPNVPKFGWQIHPITFVIDHEEYGEIRLKTEIHLINEPSSPVIYTLP